MVDRDGVEDYLSNKKKSERNYWIQLIILSLVAIFVPERYSILIFLGSIWMMLFEISDRLRTQFYFHKDTAEGMARLVSKS